MLVDAVNFGGESGDFALAVEPEQQMARVGEFAVQELAGDGELKVGVVAATKLGGFGGEVTKFAAPEMPFVVASLGHEDDGNLVVEAGFDGAGAELDATEDEDAPDFLDGDFEGGGGGDG